MNFPKLSQRKAWDRFYKDKKYIMRYPSEDVIRFVEKEIIRKRREVVFVLDLGCGNGRNLRYLEERGFLAIGVDFSKEALVLAKNKKVVCADAKKLPFRDKSFDTLICYGVLDHMTWESTKIAMDEIKRILKKKGVLYLSLRSDKDNHMKFAKSIRIQPKTYINLSKVEKDCIFYHFNLKEIEKLLCDFKILYKEREDRIIDNLIISRYHIWAEYLK